MDGRTHTDTEVPTIEASYEFKTTLPGGVVHLRVLEEVSANFLVNKNALIRTDPYPFQQDAAGPPTRPVRLVDGGSTNVSTLNKIVMPIGGIGKSVAITQEEGRSRNS